MTAQKSAQKMLEQYLIMHFLDIHFEEIGLFCNISNKKHECLTRSSSDLTYTIKRIKPITSLLLHLKSSQNLQGKLKLIDLPNPFVPNVLFIYSLKTSENHKLFRCFQGVEKGYIGNKCINIRNKIWRQSLGVFNIFWCIAKESLKRNIWDTARFSFQESRKFKHLFPD